jgi:hypothetical protein
MNKGKTDGFTRQKHMDSEISSAEHIRSVLKGEEGACLCCSTSSSWEWQYGGRSGWMTAEEDTIKAQPPHLQNQGVLRWRKMVKGRRPSKRTASCTKVVRGQYALPAGGTTW